VEVEKVKRDEISPEETNLDLQPGLDGTGRFTSRPIIAINLKTKKIRTTKVENVDNATTQSSHGGSVVSNVVKSQASHIDKWNKKQAELKGVSTTDTIPSSQVKRTPKGEPICMVCRRKFKNLEKLRAHEQLSELHRKNLSKLDKKRSTPDMPTTDYADRALRRRIMHGQTEANISQPEALRAPEVPQLPEKDSLNDKNIGNQILQRMGWKEDTSLGKERIGNSRSDEVNIADHLRKDWDRIEMLADKVSGTGRR